MRIPDINRVRVSFHGETVGSIASTPEGLMAFEYADEWLANGFSVSPFSLPLEKRVFVARWRPFDGIFGVFDDSLPDGWGRLLVDRMLAKHGLNPREVGFLARLSFVGASGMGALEYEPETAIAASLGGLDFDVVAEECARLLATNESGDLDELLALGSSSGGARPKVLTEIEGEEWIVKFPSSVDSENIGEREYRIAKLAMLCGLDVPEVRLLPSNRFWGQAIRSHRGRSFAEGSHGLSWRVAGIVPQGSEPGIRAAYEVDLVADRFGSRYRATLSADVLQRFHWQQR